MNLIVFIHYYYIMYKHLIKSALCLLGLMGTLAIWVVNAQEINKDIVLEATSTAANQTLKINKYFANAYTVDWWDGSPVQNLASDTTHTYSIASGYTITLSLSWAGRWTFRANYYYPLVPKNGTTMTWVKITYMPSLASWFGVNATAPWNNFFSQFNYQWALTSLPENSFDTSKITTAWKYFFYYFNWSWQLMSLPENSFDTSKITTVWNSFFYWFNSEWQLTSLPTGSFDTSNHKSRNFFLQCFQLILKVNKFTGVII